MNTGGLPFTDSENGTLYVGWVKLFQGRLVGRIYYFLNFQLISIPKD